MTSEAGYRVHVEEKHIREGVGGDCLRCAVALALDDATDDTECMVFESEWTLYLRVWGLVILAPARVRRFVYVMDGLDSDDEGRAIVPRELAGTEVEPFEFTLPPLDHPDWREECCHCEELFDPTGLDDEGYCEYCRQIGGPT